MKHLRAILSSWRSDFWGQVATLSVLSGTFVVFATFLLFHQNLSQMLLSWGSEVKVSVYMLESANKSVTDTVEAKIKKSDLFTRVDYLSKSEAAKRFKARVGDIVPDLMSDIDFDNPLPASFEVQVKDGVRSGRAFDQIVQWAKEAKSWAGVEEVSYGQGWVENYATVLRVFSTMSLVFVMVLLFGGLFVIGNSIRSALMQRRDEIEVLELIGATRKMIIRPYIIEGTMTGLFAAALATLVVYGLFEWQVGTLMSELQFWTVRLDLQFLSPARVVSVIFCGTLIGGLGSWVWAQRISSGWSAAESRIRRTE